MALLSRELFSLGHSNHSLERFIELLRSADITAIADVRSSPYSKRTPWFSQPELKTELRRGGFAYVFLGEELGGRPKSPELFRAGIADYAAMAQTLEFKAGLERLLTGCKSHRIAMVCSERDPLHCHRCLLVGRQLAILGVQVQHLGADGERETQGEAEDRLLREEKLSGNDLLDARSDQVGKAYTRRNRQVAYSLGYGRPSEDQWPITL